LDVPERKTEPAFIGWFGEKFNKNIYNLKQPVYEFPTFLTNSFPTGHSFQLAVWCEGPEHATELWRMLGVKVEMIDKKLKCWTFRNH
jgi:hypothetical protein